MTLDTATVFGTTRPVIGMIHLPPLPGAPQYDGDRQQIHASARQAAQTLANGGVDGVLIENFGDAPFYPDSVPPHVVAEMTTVAETVSETVGEIPIGINVLRNDAAAALSIAAAVGAEYIRVNVHTGARVADQGLLQGTAHETLRLREQIDAAVNIMADIDVKHSAPLGSGEDHTTSLAEEVERGLADAVIVSGSRTGEQTALPTIEDTVQRRDDLDLQIPVFVGSGVTTETVGEILDIADGVIVGTALKENAETHRRLDADRVRALVSAAHSN